MSWTHSSLTHHHDPPPPTPPKGPQSASAKKLAELQNKPLPQPPGLVRAMTTSRLGGESEVRQSYFEWSSESEDGSDVNLQYLRPEPEPIPLETGTTMHIPEQPHFPDPYPFRSSHHHLVSPPALSSAGSSSTRSSAYTSSGSALTASDYGHIHVASGDEDTILAMGLNPESFSQILAKDDQVSPSTRRVSQRKSQHDQGRWSESYSSGVRSRSSSLGNNSSGHGHETNPPNLKEKPSYDMGWIVDEKDEAGLSEEETDDEQNLIDTHDDSPEQTEEERTSAAVIADEGRGLIVQAESLPIAQLQVQPGTTHLLVGSSTTPNAVPPFLTNTLPQICHSLLALDISANFLGALPPVLAVCVNLEELNVASNPLRVLPIFLADLVNLRVLIADSTGISTLPDAMAELGKLHTISIRRNKLHALPSWLCMLQALQTLCIDSNPFQGPWKALVEPLLVKTPMTPMYPPSTPMFPLPSASVASSHGDTETDVDDMSDTEPSLSNKETLVQSPEDEDQTITPDRAPHLGRAVTSPLPTNSQVPRTLSRTRTTPNRAYFEQTRTKSSSSVQPSARPQAPPPITRQQSESAVRGDRELRKMKSAGELRRGKSSTALNEEGFLPLPSPAPVVTSQSTTHLVPSGSPPPAVPLISKRYGSLGPASSLGALIPRSNSNAMRNQLSKSLWENPSEPAVDTSGAFSRTSLAASSTGTFQPPPLPQLPDQGIINGRTLSHRSRPSKDAKEKGSRWGFLKKMSMGKIKVEPVPPLPPHPHLNPNALPERFSRTPQLDLRFSASGSSLEAILPPSTPPMIQHTPPSLHRQPSSDLLKGLPSITSTTSASANITPSSLAASNSLLSPPVLTSRAGKRRSFLPIDAPGGLNIPIPDNAKFVPDLTATDGSEDPDVRGLTPSPTIDGHQYQRKEEERAREAYMRALRSVMAYLKDMNDLCISQQVNPLSIYGQGPEETIGRARRPTTTVSDNLREVSIALSGASITTSIADTSSQLRPAETIAGLRSGTSSQTMSVATTDSNGSSEERKYKDDKGKRAMVIKEIVVTERTYVKGLQGLVDIYIKPGAMPVNLLTGVGSAKDTVVPMSERKIVFGGIEGLFSFHSENFLPALEKAAAPVMQSTEELQEADVDGQLSMNVARAVGNIFLKHAAFMKMYSSYINNFDNSVQRVKYWTSDKQPAATSPPSAVTSPSSSTAQLASLGLSMSVIPGVIPEGVGSTGLPALSTSQRRRLKSYLKRCRMNPRHTQLNLEGYLLLPVQRIPRYRLLLEELLRNTPPMYEYMEDPLDKALTEISSLANNMNEGKRESESRRKLVQWQSRIRGRFPSPLVQPHRRLIMDGPLLLTRVVRKAAVSFDTINPQGDAATVQVDCLAPELTPRPLIGILCNDLLVLCRDPSEGQDPNCQVDLWAVLRMQTLPQPASIVHGNALRLVDNKAILYFDAPSPSDALNWYRAINLHIPASKT